MLVIRLTRTGKIHAPHYRLVVQEKRSKLNGKAIDTVGHYHPAQAGKELVIDQEKAKAWLDKGAQPSDTVTNLFVKVGIFDKSKKVSKFFNPNKKVAATEEPAAAPKVEATEEAPAEETPATEEVVETPAAEATEEPAAPAEEAAEEVEAAAETPEEAPEVATEEPVAEEAA